MDDFLAKSFVNDFRFSTFVRPSKEPEPSYLTFTSQ